MVPSAASDSESQQQQRYFCLPGSYTPKLIYPAPDEQKELEDCERRRREELQHAKRREELWGQLE